MVLHLSLFYSQLKYFIKANSLHVYSFLGSDKCCFYPVIFVMLWVKWHKKRGWYVLYQPLFCSVCFVDVLAIAVKQG